MGGINCPPPKGAIEIPEGLKQAYVRALASYSFDLFTAAARFYSANAQIESAVLNDGNLRQAVRELQHCSESLGNAKDHLGTVHALWSELDDSDAVDFSVQMEALDEAAGLVDTAASALADIAPHSGHIQDQLWASHELTAILVDTARQIAGATSWQADFALTSQLVAA